MRVAIVATGFLPHEADKLAEPWRHSDMSAPSASCEKNSSLAWSGMVIRSNSRKIASDRSKVSVNTVFLKAMPTALPCWSMPPAGFKCHYPDIFATALINSQPMGFYAPAQIERDAREHGIVVRPADINSSFHDCSLEPKGDEETNIHERHRTMADDILSTHAIRLGFCQIKGMSKDEGEAISHKREGGFDSVRDLWLRTGLAPATLEKLAKADAFRSLGMSRRDALWSVRALRRSGDKDDLRRYSPRTQCRNRSRRALCRPCHPARSSSRIIETCAFP